MFTGGALNRSYVNLNLQLQNLTLHQIANFQDKKSDVMDVVHEVVHKKKMFVTNISSIAILFSGLPNCNLPTVWVKYYCMHVIKIGYATSKSTSVTNDLLFTPITANKTTLSLFIISP